MRSTDGGPECRYHEAASALAAGGLSVRSELCEGRGRRCPHYDACQAREGRDGPDGARVAVGVHELVHELAGHAGAAGLLAIDEPPKIVTVERIELDALVSAERHLDRFDPLYAAAMAPALRAVRAWVEYTGVDSEPGPADTTPGPIHRAIEQVGLDPDLELEAHRHTGETTVLGWAMAATGERSAATPPLTRDSAFEARLAPQLAKRLGEAARALGLIRRAILDPSDVTASVEVRLDRRWLVLTGPNTGMVEALRREGATMVLAADADVAKPFVARAVGYTPPLLSFAARECEVERTMVRMVATRSSWLDDAGNVSNRGGVVRAWQWALEWWNRRRTPGLAVVTFPVIEQALRAALGRPLLPNRAAPDDELTKNLASCLAIIENPPAIEIGHYGGLRGLDRWKELDALVTIGDPFYNVGTVEAELAWLRAGDTALAGPSDLSVLYAAAELEQAHGRLRTVHRTRPARQLHIGRVAPSGWPDGFEVREDEEQSAGPQPATLAAMVAKLGGTRVAAKLLGKSEGTIRRYASGVRAAPAELIEMVRQHIDN